MKAYASTLARRLISPSIRFRLRNLSGWLRERLGRVCLWRWEIARLTQRSDKRSYEIVYLGRKTHRDLAKTILKIDTAVHAPSVKSGTPNRTALVSELPIPGALRVPSSLRVIIPLGRPIEAIAGKFYDKLQRTIRNRRADYHIQRALEDAEINHANQEMLQPYARARHGSSAVQIELASVHRIAKDSGRLDFVLKGNELTGCIFACEVTQAKKRYWNLIRCGYPHSVFSEPKRLSESNAINFFLALEWAIDNGFDYFDMGTCAGFPEDGLLQWKKLWGGMVDVVGNHGYFYIRLPGNGAAQFLWDAPLFAIEHDKLALHLGFPEGQDDDDFSLRYRDMNRGMGIDGLFKIYLHSANPPSEGLLETLRSHYAHQDSPPIIEIITLSESTANI